MESHKIPPPIADYIQEHFLGSFLTRVNERKGPGEHTHYDVEVSHEGMVHYLEFNDHGTLLSQRMEEAFPDEHSLMDPSAD
jgi:hypothetical protein